MNNTYVFALPYLADYREGFIDELAAQIEGDLVLMHPRRPFDPSIRVFEHERSIFTQPVRRVLGGFESQKHLVAQVAKQRPARLLIEGNTRDLTYLRLLVWARLNRVPTAIWGLGRYNRPRSTIESVAGSIMTFALVTLSSHVIGKGRGPADYYRKFTWNDSKVTHAPNSSGIEEDLARIPRVGRTVIDSDNPLGVLFVGRLTEAKNLPALFTALSGLEAPWRLHLIGDGPDRTALESLARDLGISDGVQFQGNLRGDELVAAYRDADVLALPGKGGLVVPEALAAGLPLVTGPLNEAGDGTLSALLDSSSAAVAPSSDPHGLTIALNLVVDNIRGGRLGDMQQAARSAYQRHGGVQAMARVFRIFLECDL